jgi:quaternary ammonium compound-resistance protein SugE
MVWTGIGALGAFVVGVLALGEGLGVARVLAALMILGGLVIMKLATAD